jgi:hypothetical protein
LAEGWLRVLAIAAYLKVRLYQTDEVWKTTKEILLVYIHS